jgi:regulator of sigma E protease
MDILQILTSSAWSILMIAVFFGGSIFVHELGHFWVAKKRGVKVERFSIGFGPAIFKWVGKDGVEYRLSWLPLGGYVALPQLADMSGIEGEASAETKALPSPNYTTRMLVFGAGAAMNVLFAFALATIVWQVGVPTNADMQRAKIGYVVAEIELPDKTKVPSPAATAGIRAGDTILAIDGNAVKTWDEMRQMLFTGAGRTEDGLPQATLTVKRGDETLILSARPVLAGDEQMRMLGVSPYEELKVAEIAPESVAAAMGLKAGDVLRTLDGVALTSGQLYVGGLRADPAKVGELVIERDGKALTLAIPTREKAKEPADLGIAFDPEIILIHPTPWKQVSDNVRSTFRTLGSLLNRDSDVGISKLSGPIGIARVFHMTAQLDIRLVLWFTILVNVNLAIFNLLPLPVLDGGHMLFATIGRLRGRALPTSFIHAVQTGFVMVLLSMMLYVSFFDVRRISRDRAADKAEAASAPAPAPAAEPAGEK